MLGIGRSPSLLFCENKNKIKQNETKQNKNTRFACALNSISTFLFGSEIIF